MRLLRYDRLITRSAYVNAADLRTELNTRGIIERHIIPTFSCYKKGRHLSLKQVEKHAQEYTETVLVRTAFDRF